MGLSLKMKKIIGALILLSIALIGISCVSASQDTNVSDIVSVSNDVNSLESNMNSIANDTDTLKVSNDEVLTAGSNWYVNGSKTSSGNGTSDAEAFKTLKESLSVAKGGDTIMIASGEYKGTQNTDLTIDKNLNFVKYGNAKAVFDAENQRGIWTVKATSINIIGITFKNGKAEYGGAIHSKSWVGSVSVIACSFIHNHVRYGGGAIYSENYVNCTDSLFEDNSVNCDGGAIFAVGNVDIKSTTFKNNEAAYDFTSECHGGAIRSLGDVKVDNTTFDHNHAGDYGGAIYAISVYINSASYFKNNKVDDNDGGAIYAINSVNIVDSIFSDNSAIVDGGAIYAGGDVNLKNSTFKNNKAVGVLIVSQCYGGAVRSKGDVKVDNCIFDNNHVGDYGGAIYGISVYINSASSFINNIVDDNDGGAIYAENYVNVEDSIFRGNSVYVGGGAICAGGDISLKNTTFENNKAEGSPTLLCRGGAVNGQKVTIDNCSFLNNHAYDHGGAIYAKDVYINSKSSFINNAVDDKDGGAIYSGYDVNCVDSIFTGNSAYVDGGAIYAGGDVNVKNSTFENNKASGAIASKCCGGAIRAFEVIVDNSTFIGNHAYDYGGAIDANMITWVNNLRSYFIDNYVEDNCGGAIYTDELNTDIFYGVFINNQAKANDDGGAIYINKEYHGTIAQCYFKNNRCGDEGGAIYTDSMSSQLKFLNNIFIDNDAGDKGDIVYNSGYYDAIAFNWFGINNPSFDNKFKEYHTPPWSDEDHSDGYPVHAKLLLDENCEVGKECNLTVYFEDGKGNHAILPCDLIDITITADNNAKISDWHKVSECTYVTGITFANTGVTHITANVDHQVLEMDVNINSVVGKDVTKMFRNATQYYATFLDSEGKYLADGTPVQFKINGIIYDRKVSGDKGQAGLNINLPQGEYVITAINNVTGENAFNNITVLPNIVENYPIIKYYRNATQYTVKILGDDGNPVGAGKNVTFHINGRLYTHQTDASGIATLNINLPAGNYIITAEYNGCKVSNDIKVLPVLFANDLTKKYDGSEQFVASLVDGQGKLYAGQVITFNIDGKLYNILTDGKGQAALNIRLPPGEYIITSSFNGANIANKITITG
jgi:predicted outer membrane repeat protein